MYVVCHKCAAAYLVEDGLVVRGDERAQCPNCLHVQALAPANAQAPAAPATRRAAHSSPLGARPQPFRVPSIPPVGSQPDPLVLDQSPLPDSANAQSKATTCEGCGAPLSDAFDRALGICEACRADAQRPAPRLPAQPTQPVVSDERAALKAGGANGQEAQETLGLPLIEHSTAHSTEFNSSSAREWTTPEEVGSEPALARDPTALLNAEAKPASRWNRARVFGATVFIAALAAAGAVLLMQRRVQPAAPEPEKASLPPRLERAREQWKRDSSGLQTEAFKYLKEGELELAKDTPPDYLKAEKSFQKAFVLEAEGNQALAGYLQAVAWGRGKSLEDADLEDLTNIAESAELHWGRSARILLAHASLALLRPNSPRSAERARSFAQEALGLASGREKALAHLVLSSAFLSSSSELAIQNAELALKLDPSLRRAYFQRALARESLGDYRSAIADLQKRISLDSDEQSQAKADLARIYQEVGEPALAYRLYEPTGPGGTDLAALLARAMIQYQSAHRAQAAAQALAEGIRRYGRVDPPSSLVDAWVHLAAAERLSGKLEAALNSANQALAISSSDPAANLQLFLIALQGGSFEAAGLHLQAWKRRLDDPALEKLLEGRLFMARRREAEAMRSFADAAQLDPRRLDALLLAGAAAASVGRRDEALRYLVLAGQMDPTRTAPAAIATRFYVTPEENLTGAQGRVVRLAKGSTDVTPRLYEALIRFHQRDFRAADKLLQQVVEIDGGNALAHALRALIALNGGAPSLARVAAERAVAVGRGVALAHFAHGSVLARGGKLEEARAEFRQAEVLAPSLLATQVKLAELDAMKESKDAARARLVHVLRVDPSYLAAKRALYALER